MAASQDHSNTRSKRLEPPKLFVPPSRNLSTTDLSSPSPTSARAPPLGASSSGTSTNNSPRHQTDNIGAQPPQRQRQASTTSQTWAELQNTLEEVELSAASGAHVFGADHSRALEELRKAQVELARAWARGEEGEQEGDESGDEGLSLHKEGSHQGMREASAVLASDRSQKIGAGAGEGAGRDTGSSGKFGAKKSQLEEETENDILLARKRRLANDKYFERVNKGVVDVVAKLEIVAEKMGGVEMESQEIWGDRDSLDDGTTTG